jgi:hypothetical protein
MPRGRRLELTVNCAGVRRRMSRLDRPQAYGPRITDRWRERNDSIFPSTPSGFTCRARAEGYFAT